MSFLDNLEKGEELTADHQRREMEHASALAAAPWAEQLKTGPWTKALIDLSAAASHRLRAKLYLAWIGTTLRLEVRERRLELRPTPAGIVAVVLSDGKELHSEPVVETNPQGLIDRWLSA